jgi:hypothetical protein
MEEEDDNNPNFKRRVNEITEGEGMAPYVRRHLLEGKVSRVNASVIVEYIQAFSFESNPSTYSRQVTIATLNHLSEFHKNKPFKEMTRKDILTFLNRLRKSDEQDSLYLSSTSMLDLV